MSRSQFSRDRERSRNSGPNSVGAGARAVRDGPALLGAGAVFRSRDLLSDRIYNGTYINFGIKYYRMHEKIGAGSEDAGAGAVKDRSQPGRSRGWSCKDRSQICRSRDRNMLLMLFLLCKESSKVKKFEKCIFQCQF
jgi:hypothetical protein